MLVLQLFLPMAKTRVRVLLRLVINRVVGLFNCLPSAISLALKYQVNIKHLQVAFSNCKSTATITCNNTLAILLRHMAHQTRCTVNVTTPLIFFFLQNDSNFCTR